MHSKTTATDYRDSSRAMMAQSRDELAKGDLQQASDKGWCATAHMMKALAENPAGSTAGTGTYTKSPVACGPRPANGTSTACSTPPAPSTRTSTKAR